MRKFLFSLVVIAGIKAAALQCSTHKQAQPRNQSRTGFPAAAFSPLDPRHAASLATPYRPKVTL